MNDHSPAGLGESIPYYKFLILVALLLLAFLCIRSKSTSSHILPPGPKPLPILGNLHQFSTKSLWIKFREWSSNYGPLVYLNLAGVNVIVLDSHEVVNDLLTRRSEIYSDRLSTHVCGDILTTHLAFPLEPYNDFWKRSRRGAQQALNSNSVNKYIPTQFSEARILLRHLLQKPQDFYSQLRRTSGSLIFRVMYGLPPLSEGENPYYDAVMSFTKEVTTSAVPGSHMVDLIPFLRYLPRAFSPWRISAEAWNSKVSVVLLNLFLSVRNRLEKGDQSACAAATLIEHGMDGLSTKEAAWMMGTLIGAAGGTTPATLAYVIHALVCNPTLQSTARKELDLVVGHDRMPRFEDMEHLPFIQALVLERLRWRPALPLAIPHRAAKDDVYNGYHIPKGTICIPNIWSLNRDESIYGKNTEDFIPERHLDSDGQLKEQIQLGKARSHDSFGFGRRICVGRYLAHNSLLISLSTLLWAFTFEPLKDKDGQPLIPILEDVVDEGITIRPAPFDCDIKPRFPEVRDILSQYDEDD